MASVTDRLKTSVIGHFLEKIEEDVPEVLVVTYQHSEPRTLFPPKAAQE